MVHQRASACLGRLLLGAFLVSALLYAANLLYDLPSSKMTRKPLSSPFDETMYVDAEVNANAASQQQQRAVGSDAQPLTDLGSEAERDTSLAEFVDAADSGDLLSEGVVIRPSPPENVENSPRCEDSGSSTCGRPSSSPTPNDPSLPTPSLPTPSLPTPSLPTPSPTNQPTPSSLPLPPAPPVPTSSSSSSSSFPPSDSSSAASSCSSPPPAPQSPTGESAAPRFAFSILIHNELRLFRRLFRRLYRERHVYVLNIDAKVSPEFRSQVLSYLGKFRQHITVRDTSQVIQDALARASRLPSTSESSPVEPHASCAPQPALNFSNIIVTSSDVRWGEAGIIDAQLKALCLASSTSTGFDFFFTLSGTHYPLRSIEHMEKFLDDKRDNNFVAFVDEQSRWHKEASRLKGRPRIPGLKYYTGWNWVVLNRQFTDHLLRNIHVDYVLRDLTPATLQSALGYDIVRAWLGTGGINDEAFFQIVLKHSPFRDSVAQFDLLHHIVWSRNNKCCHRNCAHPCTLTLETEAPYVEFKALLPSNGHLLFARKFSLEEWDSYSLILHIDAHVKQSTNATSSASPVGQTPFPFPEDDASDDAAFAEYKPTRSRGTRGKHPLFRFPVRRK